MSFRAGHSWDTLYKVSLVLTDIIKSFAEISLFASLVDANLTSSTRLIGIGIFVHGNISDKQLIVPGTSLVAFNMDRHDLAH
jgi:hypothetical protein